MTGHSELRARPQCRIAIVGMAARLPGALDLAQYWQLLYDGREGISYLSEEVLRANGVTESQLADPAYVRCAPVLQDIDRFDAAFFGISPAEAQGLDPQQRLFVEQSWAALEDAAIDPRRISVRTGVFAGAALSGYLWHCMSNADFVLRTGELQIGLANDKDSLATRTAYLLDLTGPAVTVQTYCSTSLVAVAMAASSVAAGECDLAVAGGVAINVPHEVGYQYEEGGLSSPDGKCRAFNADSQGTPIGSGVGVVVLKRLDDAVRDGDPIRAVLPGWAINNDGGQKAGFTAPGSRGQAAVVAAAIERAGLTLEDIDYIEAHAPGTPLGDSVELAALARVFSGGGREVLLGSVKTNIGHVDRASGVAGLIKTVLAMENQILPATLHYERPNAQLDSRRFRVVATNTPWPREPHRLRRAGVSSFGIGGTNAHVIVEEAPSLAPSSAATRSTYLCPWSARTDERLEALTEQLAEHLQRHPAPLPELAATLQRGRTHHERRRCAVLPGQDSLLDAIRDGRFLEGTDTRTGRRVVFLLHGVGEQYAGMLARLYDDEPMFREKLDARRESLSRVLGTSDPLDHYLTRTPDEPKTFDFAQLAGRGSFSTVGGEDSTGVLQPVMFIAWHALAETFIAWGVEPALLLGYSLGEYVASSLSGSMEFEAALRLVAHRAELIASLPESGMIAASLGEQAATALIRRLDLPIDIAAVNGPRATVLAGASTAVSDLEAHLEAESVPAKRLRTTHAFHSRQLRPLMEELTDYVRDNVTIAADRIPVLSNVTGRVRTDGQLADPGYWAAHMVSPVRFADACGAILDESSSLVLELGPGQSLTAMIRALPGMSTDRWDTLVSTVPAIHDSRCTASIQEAAARLWLAGVELDWHAFAAAGESGPRHRIPGYPFARERHWVQPALNPAPIAGTSSTAGAPVNVLAPTWADVTPPPGDEPTAGRTLILSESESPFAQQLQIALSADSAQIITTDECSTPDSVGELLQQDPSIDAIVNLWPLAPADALTGPLLLEATARLLAVANAAAPNARLLTVTAGAERVSDSEVPDPHMTWASRVSLIARQEFPGLAAQWIDAGALTADQEVLRATTANIAAILDAAGPREDLSVRGVKRYRRSYAPASSERSMSAVRRGGCYLIIGGAGRVGRHLLREFAAAGAGAIILTGRSARPAPDQWGTLPDDHPQRDLCRAIEDVPPNCAVELLRLDVSDEVALSELLEDLEARHGRVDGVVLASAASSLESYSPLAELNMVGAGDHFAAKVTGATALAKVLAPRQPDFVLLFSSISTVLGGLGFAAYATANAFLEQLAVQQRLEGRPWCAIAWDTWADTGHDGASGGFGDAQASHIVQPTEAMRAIDLAIASGHAAVLAAVGDLDARRQQWGGGFDDSERNDLRARPDLPQSYVQPATRLERRLAEIWGEVLGIGGVGTRDNFFDLGGTSLMGLQLLRRMRGDLKAQLPAVALFECPTVELMAAKIETSGPATEASGTSHEEQALSLSLPAEYSRGASAADASRPAGGEANNTAPARDPLLIGASRVEGASEQGKANEDARAAAAASQPSLSRRPPRNEPVAIVGWAGRFPGASSVNELWRNLRGHVESIRFFSDDELRAAGVMEDSLTDPDFVKARPVLDNVGGFDAPFFGFSPQDARLADPQQRIFLEVAWEALEDAGYGAVQWRPTIGVFAGANLSSYMLFNLEEMFMQAVNDFQIVVGNDKDALTTVTSYRMNLTGPSFGVQTFCSTSLVAVHLAMQSLRSGDCEMALAGGVSIRIPTVSGHQYVPGGMGSSDGHVRVFDADASGSMFGDGAAVVLLKPLHAAIRDGDDIRAVIRGSAVNNDGSRKAGFSAPSVVGQSRVVQAALDDAGVVGDDLTFVEAHGTGTLLGDPIEVAALTRAFGSSKRGTCALASVKANVGHLDRASGVTGLIKAALALRDCVLPGTLHFKRPNPELRLDEGPFYVTSEAVLLRERDDGLPLLCGVSSLGMGGTNAHVVLEAPPPVPTRHDPVNPGRRWALLPLSGRSEQAVNTMEQQLVEHLDANAELDLRDVAWTLQVGRERFNERSFALVQTVPRWADEGRAAPPRFERRFDPVQRRSVVLVLNEFREMPFGLLAETYRREAQATALLDSVRDQAASAVGVDIVGHLIGECQLDPSPGGRMLDAGGYLAAVVASALLVQLGVSFDAVTGSGAGFVAACVAAGSLSIEAGLRIVLQRADAFGDDSAEAELGHAVVRERPQPPTTPLLWHGSRPSGEENAANWQRYLTEPCGLGESLSRQSGSSELAVVAIGDVNRVLLNALSQNIPTLFLVDVDLDSEEQDDFVLARAVGRLWAGGAHVDWPQFASVANGRFNRRVSLPTYPFERHHYWIAEGSQKQEAAQGSRADDLFVLAREPEDQWLYLPAWRQVQAVHGDGVEGERWIALVAGPLGRRVLDRLEQQQPHLQVVRADVRFGVPSQAPVVDVDGDAVELCNLLDRVDVSAAKRVVDLTSLDLACGDDRRPEADLSHFLMLVTLAREISNRGVEAWRLDVVTSGAVNAIASDRPDATNALLLGPVRVIPLEYPGARARLIDYVEVAGLEDAGIDNILAELTSATGGDRLVALRGNDRLTPVYERMRVNDASSRGPALVKTGNTYLITGGLGGIGLAMAERMAAEAPANFVLLGRQALPPRSEWSRILTAQDDPDLVRRVEGVQRMESVGAQVLCQSVDLADGAAVQRELDTARAHFGAIHGVLHAAGLPGMGLMQFKDPADMATVMSPKVVGTLHLEEALQGDELDYFVTFGSITSMTGGGPGQVDYCAANAFTDAFAHSRQMGLARRVLTVSWGEWTWNAWSAGLEGFNEELRSRFEESRAATGIDFDTGYAYLRRCLSESAPHLVVCTQDFGLMVLGADLFNVETVASQSSGAPAERYPRPTLSVPYTAPRNDAEHKMAELWGEVLCIDKVGVHDRFFELGGNSLVGVDLIARARKAFGLTQLAPYLLYEAPTVASLLQAMAQQTAKPAADEPSDRRVLRIANAQRVLAGGAA